VAAAGGKTVTQEPTDLRSQDSLSRFDQRKRQKFQAMQIDIFKMSRELVSDRSP
jgi:hypothetical protein